MSNQHYLQLKKKEAKKRKVNNLGLKGPHKESIFNLNEKMSSATYINAFNLYLTRLRDLEYKPKNPDLYTWKLSMQYMQKLRMPRLFLDQELKKERKQFDKTNFMRNMFDYPLTQRNPNTDANFALKNTVNKVRGVLRPFSLSKETINFLLMICYSEEKRE